MALLIKANDGRHIIGREGEILLASLLKNSRHINKVSERHKPWDVTWRGIHIDVKTTTLLRANNTVGFAFNSRWSKPRTREDDIYYVFIFNTPERQLFWVRYSMLPKQSTHAIKDAITADSLEEAIMAEYNKYSYKVSKQLELL